MPRDATLLDAHRTALERFRASMNLVGPGPVQPHFDDCTAALQGLEPEGHWADLGSGAGFPGLVFAAMYPEVRLDLVDSRQKRCIFLEEVIARADAWGIDVLCTRIEELDQRYDGLLARALAPPEQVVDWAEVLLRPGGHLVILLNEGQELPEREGWTVTEVPYTVDGKARKTARLVRSPTP